MVGRGDTRYRDHRDPVPIVGSQLDAKELSSFELLICALAARVGKKPAMKVVKKNKEQVVVKKKVDQGETKIWECSICGKKYKSVKPPAKCGMCFYNFFKEGKELIRKDAQTTYKSS